MGGCLRTPSGPAFDDVPDNVAAAAREGHICMGAEAYSAAAILARAVVEATAKDKGITEGGIEKKIDKLRDCGLISVNTRQAAHEVRYLGNDMAHGDFVEPVAGRMLNSYWR